MGASADWKAVAAAKLEQRIGYVAEQLADQPYLLGDEFSIGDAYLWVVLSWAAHVDFDLGKWPVLSAYQARIGARPAVQAALKAEGLA
jgi:glutathione S-transferase